MACSFDANVMSNLRRLAASCALGKDTTPAFERMFAGFVKQMSRLNTPYSFRRCDIDRQVADIAEKFVFHGFVREAGFLNALYHMYLDSYTTAESLQQKLAVVQLLLALSISPTSYLAALEQPFECPLIEDADQLIDWPAYLREGIEPWNPNFDETDEDYSSEGSIQDDEDKSSQNRIIPHKVSNKSSLPPQILEKLCYKAIRIDSCIQILCGKAQCSWWNASLVRDLPSSSDDEANIALRWEKFLLQKGIISAAKTNILSQYKVIREILWQMNAPHNSAVFTWCSNKLIVKNNVTVPSLRPFVFKPLVDTFLPHINVLHKLRSYYSSVLENTSTPHTFNGYAEAIMQIVSSVMQQINKVTSVVSAQERTMTLNQLADECRAIFPRLHFLNALHNRITLKLHQKHHTNDYCAMYLLSKLHHEMAQVFTKPDMDIVIALYVDSVYKWAHITEWWFRLDQLHDTQNEYPIMPAEGADDFVMRPNTNSAIFAHDNLLKIMRTHVIPIGRQIRLLRRLGKLSLLGADDFSIYQQWRRNVLNDLRCYSPLDSATTLAITPEKPLYKPPIAADPFLDTYFDEVFNVKSREREEMSTYDTIMRITRNAHAPIERIVLTRMRELLEPLHCRVSEVLKRVLVAECALSEHIAILWELYLFADDVIGPFYRRVFAAASGVVDAGNDCWFTFYLRDALSNAHASLAQLATVELRMRWSDVLDDAGRVCAALRVTYRLPWPVDIIVTAQAQRMYREIFAFLLRIKWALFVLHEMARTRTKWLDAPKCVRVLVQRLELLRFACTTIFSALQHHVMGYMYAICTQKYLNEKASDIDEMAAAHASFIAEFHRVCARLRDYKEDAHGISMALYLLQKLRKMWLAPGDVVDSDLKFVEGGLRTCHANIFDVLSYQVFELL